MLGNRTFESTAISFYSLFDVERSSQTTLWLLITMPFRLRVFGIETSNILYIRDIQRTSVSWCRHHACRQWTIAYDLWAFGRHRNVGRMAHDADGRQTWLLGDEREKLDSRRERNRARTMMSSGWIVSSRRPCFQPVALLPTASAVTKQEAQLMLTTGSTRLAVSRGQQTWYHSTCYI